MKNDHIETNPPPRLQTEHSNAKGHRFSCLQAIGQTTTACAIIAAAALTASSGHAQSFDAALYDGGKARVNLSARLRALSEDVAAASCRLVADLDADAARADLSKAQNDINRILAGLKDGDPALGIPNAETTGRMTRSIDAVAALWAPLNAATVDLVDGNTTPENLAVVSADYRALFDETVVLASETSGQYSNPLELMQSDAVTLNFLGRQLMLVDRISRNICGIATGTDNMGTAEELAQTMDLFEKSLIALRDGFPDAGISAPPNDAVKNSLVAAFDRWEEKKSILAPSAAGEPVSNEAVIEVTALMDALKVEFNNTITLYLISSPGQDGVYRVPLTAYAEGELASWLTDPALIAAIKEQNTQHSGLNEDQIIALDQTWRAEAKAGGGELISRLLDSDVSGWLADHQDDTAGFVTEVFVMDNRGLNVAQSVETSDYWQGDEAKWKETYGREDGGLHISEVEFDDSTGFYQTQASMPIFDPATGEKIGAVTFGINVQSLM